MNAHTRRAGRRPGPVAELLVRELVDDAQLQRFELAVTQCGECLVEAFQPPFFRFLLGWPVFAEKVEPLAREALEPVSAHRRDEDVPCDREQPRGRRTARTVLEAG